MVASKNSVKQGPARPKLDVVKPKAKCGVKMRGPVNKDKLEQHKKKQEEITNKKIEDLKIKE